MAESNAGRVCVPKKVVRVKTDYECGFVTDCVTTLAGGLYHSVSSLGKALHAQGVGMSVFGLLDPIKVSEMENWEPLKVNLFPRHGPRSFGLDFHITKALLRSECDIVHTHGIWQGVSLSVLRWSLASGKPYLISPRGMLDPWAIANSSFKKRFAGFAYENAHLKTAACIHCLCASEVEAVRARGLSNPICLVPNGVDLPEARAHRLEARVQKKQLLFLGRIHPKKGLANALRAWASLRTTANRQSTTDEWQFVIAGWDQGGKKAKLEWLCKELGLSYSDIPASDYVGETPSFLESSSVSFVQSVVQNSSSVIFTGPVFGANKDQLLQQASAFILPSFSEGLPMAVLEAWSYGLPVLMTDMCNLPEGFAANAALRIGTDVESIAEGLRWLYESPISILQSLGDNGRQLVSERFTWPQISAQMKEVYDWVLGGGDKPNSVVTI